MIFLQDEVLLNPPGKETLTAGLGPIEQYSITLIALIIIGIISYIIKKKKAKKKNKNEIH